MHLAAHHLLNDNPSFVLNISESLQQKGTVVKNTDSGTKAPGYKPELVPPLTSCVTLKRYSTILCLNYLIWKVEITTECT